MPELPEAEAARRRIKDGALSRSGIDPEAHAADLSAQSVALLHTAVRDILQAVADTRAACSKLPKDWLIHIREAGNACGRGDGSINKKTAGGRASYHCPNHQAAA